MFVFLCMLMFLIVLIGVVFLLGISLSKKLLSDQEKNSPFECGFSPKFNARMPFSMRFFLITLIFLVFDVELVLMFPFIISIYSSDLFLSSLFILLFLAILVVGVSHEWNQGSLDWAA